MAVNTLLIISMLHLARSLLTAVRMEVLQLLHIFEIVCSIRSSGLLVAACVNRAPEGLIGAAIAQVGVLDMLKVRT